MNFKEALRYLDRFTNYEIPSSYNYKRAYNLNRLERLLKLFGNPQHQYPSIAIAGTKGKGSSAVMLASVLKQSGLKTGLFISPHLISITERIQVNGKHISEKEFSDIVLKIKGVLKKSSLKGLTYFEILTTVCFLYFCKLRVDMAVLEVGLGGRLDATKVAKPIISLITPISYDHTHLLGGTIKEIAFEKSGIITKGSYVVSAPQDEKALSVIKKVTNSKKAKLFLVGDSIRYKNLNIGISKTTFDVRTPSASLKNIKLSLLGRHQAINALAVIGCLWLLSERFGFNIKEKDISSGLDRASIPGRLQAISKRPLTILDGAQNPASAKALRVFLEEVFTERCLGVLVLGISSDKEIEAIGRRLCPLAEKVIFTKADSPRAMDPKELASRLGRFCNKYYISYDINDAALFAKALCKDNKVILFTGSLFLIGEALAKLNKGLSVGSRAWSV